MATARVNSNGRHQADGHRVPALFVNPNRDGRGRTYGGPAMSSSALGPGSRREKSSLSSWPTAQEDAPPARLPAFMGWTRGPRLSCRRLRYDVVPTSRRLCL